jgi:hypothetical protein
MHLANTSLYFIIWTLDLGTPEFNLLAGWIGMLGGVLSGALIGLYFHKEEWMGGYGSYRRRLARLGHISFFGLGFVNLLFGLSANAAHLPIANSAISSVGFLVGAISMPITCFLTAWRQYFRHLFPIPVASVLIGIVSMLAGWQ